MEEIQEVTALLEEHGIGCEEDGYISLPKEHAFAVWRIAHREARGADGYALYWDAVVEVRIFYRDIKTDTDKRREKLIEEGLRGLDRLESDYDYNPEDKLDITKYKFITQMDF